MFFRTETNNTHARPQTRGEYETKNGFTRLGLIPQIGHHKLQQGSRLDVTPRRQAQKQTNCKTSDRQHGAHTANAIGSLTQWQFDAITTLYFDKYSNLRWLSNAYLGEAAQKITTPHLLFQMVTRLNGL